MKELTNIFMTSGVNQEGKGFITIAAHGDDGTILTGQLSPDEVRAHALGYLETAEAADQDAAVLRVVRKLGIHEEFAAVIITELRESRES